MTTEFGTCRNLLNLLHVAYIDNTHMTVNTPALRAGTGYPRVAATQMTGCKAAPQPIYLELRAMRQGAMPERSVMGGLTR